MKRFFIFSFVALSLTCVSCSFLENLLGGKAEKNEPAAPVKEAKEEEPQADLEYVYSNGFDGFVNLRYEPSFSSEIAGVLRNGFPAVYQGQSYDEKRRPWTLVEIDGLMGWAPSKFIQSEPTLEYTGKVDVSWIEGVWGEVGGMSTLYIYNNGTFEEGTESYLMWRGRYILQNNEIKFTTTWEEDESDGGSEWVLPINKKDDMLGNYQRYPFISEQLEDEGEGDMDHISKSSHRKRGKSILAQVEKEDPR